MKKIVSFIIVLGIILLMFQFGVTFFKNKHSVDYTVKIGKKEISIHEEYSKDKHDDYYFFKLKLEDNTFVFDEDNLFNKQKKVITGLHLYEEDDLTCISPIYINKNDDTDIICVINNKQYSYLSIKDKYDLTDFIDELDGYDEEKYESSNKTSNISTNTVYKGNMYDDENIVVYDYNRLIAITKPSYKRIKFANYDVYQNELGILIGKYYVLPKYEKRPEYTGFIIIDITVGNQETVYFDEAVSTNLYINGVVNNKLYIFDKSNLIQYEIDPKNKSYRITGDKSTDGQYYDGEEWINKNIYDFSKQEITFGTKYQIKDNYVEAFETNKYYYYYNRNNEFYKVYKKSLDRPIYLFEDDDMKEVKVINDKIYFIKDNTLYRFDDTGLKKILTNNEFKYNYNNIYSVYY